MVNNSISRSSKFKNLPDDTCRLLATWIISHLDKNGVFYGDPVMVRSLVFPWRSDVSIEAVEHYLQEMQKVGLIVLFEADGEKWQYWPGFNDNQIGLRADRETSTYPEPPQDSSQDGDNDQDAPTPDGNLDQEAQPPSGNLPEESRNHSGSVPPERRPNKKFKEKVNLKTPTTIAHAHAREGPEQGIREKIPKQNPADQLATYYQQETGNAPRGITDAQMWEDDCCDILDLAGGDVGRARGLIDEAVEILNRGRYTHKSPGSLIKTITGQIQQVERKNGAQNGHSGKRKKPRPTEETVTAGHSARAAAIAARSR
jgi:hypothetical protein